MVQALPSSQDAPSALAGFEHAPDEVLHVPTVWHWSLAGQVFAAPPTQVPPEQTSPVVHALPSSQDVPSDLAPLSTQELMPAEQVRMPVLQGELAMGQACPATHAVQAPERQTLPLPQAVPSSALPLSTHIEVPVEHDNIPLWQGVATEQLPPAAQATHWPLLHTMPSPHAVPAARPRQLTEGEESTVLPASLVELSGMSRFVPPSTVGTDF